jgi:hypothetical protein
MRPTAPGLLASTRRAARSHSSSSSALFTALKVSARASLLSLVTLWPLAARAQVLVRGITSLTSGASDNAKGQARPRQKHSTSIVGRASAGLDLGYQGSRSNHLLRLGLGATGYPGSDGGTSFSQELALVSQFAWQRVNLELGATGAHSELSDLQPLVETNLTAVENPDPVAPPFTDQIRPGEDLTPTDTVGYLGGSLAEAISFELSPVWSLYQSGGVELFAAMQGNDVAPPIWSVSTDVGVERAWSLNALRLEMTVGHETAPQTISQEGLIPAEDGEFGRAALGWIHQFSPNWRGDLTGGAYGARASNEQKTSYGPAWRAALNWKGRWFRAGAIYDHTAQPSVVLGGIYLTDRASVRASGRFGRDERFRFTGLLRYTRLGAIGGSVPLIMPPPPDLMNPTPPEPPGPPDPDLAHDHANRWQSQVTVGFVPWPNRLFELALSYRLTTQTGATLGRRRMKTFERNMVLLTLTFGLPTRAIE